MKYFLLILSFLALTVQAAPMGFEGPSTRQPPKGFHSKQEKNTVKGIIKNAETGDYVLLDGQFTKRLNRTTYLFTDLTNNKENTIEVIISDIRIVPVKNARYFIWGTLEKSLLKHSIDIEFISQPRPLNTP